MFPLILLYVVLTIIRPQDYVPGLETAPILPVVLLLAFAMWLASRSKTFEAPQFVILPAFLLILMISQMSNGWAGGALDELARFGPVVIAFFVFGAACGTQKRVRIAMGVFVACATVLALHGVEQVSTGVGWTGTPLSEGGRIQYVGIFNDPNDLGRHVTLRCRCRRHRSTDSAVSSPAGRFTTRSTRTSSAKRGMKAGSGCCSRRNVRAKSSPSRRKYPAL